MSCTARLRPDRNTTLKEALTLTCLLELINRIDVETQNKAWTSLKKMYVNMLDSEALENHELAFSRKWPKERHTLASLYNSAGTSLMLLYTCMASVPWPVLVKVAMFVLVTCAAL